MSDLETDAFLYSTFAYVDKDDRVWFGKRDIPRTKVSLDDLNQSLALVAEEIIFPRTTDHDLSLFTIVRDPVVLADAYIKRPKLAHLDEEIEQDSRVVPRMFLQEIGVLEELRPYPHPNLVRYLGCTVKRSYITGIVLERHNMVLSNRFWPQVTRGLFDNAACIEQLRAGIWHLHSLGYAHNDLNPTNIALDDDDSAVILDFGSCMKFGEDLLSAGTPGWADDYSTSEPEHDEDALKRIKIWLAERWKGTPGDVEERN